MLEICRVSEDMVALGIVKKGAYRLSSGKTSNIYIDLREALGHPVLRSKLLSLLASKASSIIGYVDVVAGVATGGIPWASMLAMLYGKPLAYVRSAAKQHGTGRLVEGARVEARSVLLVDDVATTGSSLARAVDAITREGGYTGYAVVVVDRLEGAREKLAEKGVKLVPALTMRDILECSQA